MMEQTACVWRKVGDGGGSGGAEDLHSEVWGSC